MARPEIQITVEGGVCGGTLRCHATAVNFVVMIFRVTVAGVPLGVTLVVENWQLAPVGRLPQAKLTCELKPFKGATRIE